tara:strand:+ start:126 stop:404 length:279 start_codon:yes stop_codon:yes gene_type:complete
MFYYSSETHLQLVLSLTNIIKQALSDAIHICVDDKGLYRARTSGRLIVVEFLICQIVSLLSSPPSPSPVAASTRTTCASSRSSTSPTDEDEE